MVVSFLTEFWSLDHSSFTENLNSTPNQETPLLFAYQITFSLTLFSSVVQSCLTLCNPTDCSTPGLPVHRQLLEFIQTHIHRIGNNIQPSHPLSSPQNRRQELRQTCHYPEKALGAFYIFPLNCFNIVVRILRVESAIPPFIHLI